MGFANYQQAETAIKEAPLDYNQNTIHSSIGYISPYEKIASLTRVINNAQEYHTRNGEIVLKEWGPLQSQFLKGDFTCDLQFLLSTPLKWNVLARFACEIPSKAICVDFTLRGFSPGGNPCLCID